MARYAALGVLVLGAVADASALPGANSVQKVIQMLTDMSAKGKQEKNKEQIAFATFSTWCSQESASLQKEISGNTEEMDLLGTSIGKLQSDVTSLGESIATLNSDVSGYEASKKAETNQRAKDHESFLAADKDYSESIDALDRAVAVLQEQNYDRTSAEAVLMQLPEKARALSMAFLETTKEEPDHMAYQAPEANGYEFQSSSIVEVLKKLKDDFRTKLGETQKEEMNSKHAYNMIMNDLADSIQNSEKEIQEKTMEKQRKAENAAKDKRQLSATTAVKADNEKTLSATKTECQEKQLSFQEKQNLRTEEIEAIEKAIEILSSPEVSGHAEKYLSMAQSNSATAFVQMGERQASAGIRRKVRDFLVAEGKRLHSQGLGLLAEKLTADPFSKVKKMIDGMITRLMEEANEDANHEGFCDTEMGKSKITRTRLSEEIDGLDAAVEEGKAMILKLTQSTATLSKEVQDLLKSMADSTEMRNQERATNAETVKDAKAAQAAVQAATAVLKAFYEKAATATALVQAPTSRRWGLKMGVKMGSDEWNSLANTDLEGTVDTGHKEGMQTFGETAEGQQDENDYGVLALLEVIQSDFATLEANTQAAEAEAQRSYEEFMVDSKRSQAAKDRKIEMNNSDKAAAEAKLQEDIADLKATQDELLAADRYHANLVPQCIDQGMTFEDRTKSRAEEIASLKEALKILSSEDIVTSA